MFEINKYNTNANTFWLKAIDTMSSIIITHVEEENLIDFRVFNEETIFQKDFSLDENVELSFLGELSMDGNEYDVRLTSSEELKLFLNFYYSLDDNIVISTVEKGKRQEIITLPNAILN